MINNESREITIELAELVFKQTNDAEFTRHVCIFVDTDAKKKQLIKFIKENNPSLNEINYHSVSIAMCEVRKNNIYSEGEKT